MGHILGIRWEIDIAAYFSSELGEEVGGEGASVF